MAMLLTHFNGVADSQPATTDTGEVINYSGTGHKLSTAFPKFGSAALQCPGFTIDYMTINETAGSLTFAGDFTIDMWVKLASGQESEWSHFIDSAAGQLDFYRDPTSGVGRLTVLLGGLPYYGPAFAFDTNWHHIMVSRSGSNVYLGLDGTVQLGGTKTGTLGDGTLVVGCVGGGEPQAAFSGQIDELRVLNDTAAWTSNFTPPTQEYSEPVLAPTIEAQPSNATIFEGETGTFGVSASNVDYYNWYSYIDGVTGTFGETGPNLYIDSAQRTAQGEYRAVALNGSGSAESDPATLTVNWGPEISLQPTGVTVLVGNPFTLTAGATGQPDVTGMTWWKVGDGQVGVGDTYNVASASESDEAGYYALATNGVGPDATSVTAFVYVDTTESITQQPRSIITTLSQNVTFTVVATTDPSYSTLYQWNKNGSNVSGATGASFGISDVQTSDLASYNVVITNGPVTLTSDQATLSIRSSDNESPQSTIGTPGTNGNNAPGGGGGRGARMGSVSGDTVNNDESRNHVHAEHLVQKEGARLGNGFRYPAGRSSRQEY